MHIKNQNLPNANLLSNEIIVNSINHMNQKDLNAINRDTSYKLMLFEKGENGAHLIDFKTHHVTPKSLFFIQPGQIHHLKRKPNEDGLIIQFSKSTLTQSMLHCNVDFYLLLMNISKINLSDLSFRRFNKLFKKMKKIHERESSLKTAKLTQLLGFILLDLLELIYHTPSAPKLDKHPYQFLYELERHFAKFKKVKQYAALLNLSESVLNRKIKEQFGKTPLNFIHERILVEIKRLMIIDKITHKEIAHILNFDSQSSYSRFIKKHTDLTPSAFFKKTMANI